LSAVAGAWVIRICYILYFQRFRVTLKARCMPGG
jgi:hypothetical protein